MPLVNPDFSQSNEQKTPNRAGQYVCKIESAEVKTGRDSGQPYVNWKLFTEEGRIVFHSTPLTGKAAGMFKHFVHCAGDKAYLSGPYGTEALIGKYVFMTLEVNEKGYFVTKEVLPLSSSQLSVLQESDSNEFDRSCDIPF